MPPRSCATATIPAYEPPGLEPPPWVPHFWIFLWVLQDLTFKVTKKDQK